MKALRLGWRWMILLIPGLLIPCLAFASPTTLSSASHEDFSPDVEIGPEDQVYIVWERCTLAESTPVVHHVVIRKITYNTLGGAVPTIHPVQVVSTSSPSRSSAGTPTPRVRPMVRVDPNWWPPHVTPVPSFTPTPTKTPSPTPPTWCSHTPTPDPVKPTNTPSPTQSPTPQHGLHVTWLNFDDGENLPPAVVATTHYDYDTDSSDRIDFATGRNSSLKDPFAMPIPKRDWPQGSGLKVVFVAERNDVDAEEDVFWANLLHLPRNWDLHGDYYWTGLENIIRPDYIRPERFMTPTPTPTLSPTVPPGTTATPTAGPWKRNNPTADQDLKAGKWDRLFCAFAVDDTSEAVDGIWVYGFIFDENLSDSSMTFDEDEIDGSKQLLFQEWAPLESASLYPLGDSDCRLPFLKLDDLSGDDRVNLVYIDTNTDARPATEEIKHTWFVDLIHAWDDPVVVDDEDLLDIRPAMDFDSNHDLIVVYVKSASGEERPYYNTADWESGSYSWDAENGTQVTESTTYVDIQWIDVATLKDNTGVAHVVWSAKEDSEDDYEIYWQRITFD